MITQQEREQLEKIILHRIEKQLEVYTSFLKERREIDFPAQFSVGDETLARGALIEKIKNPADFAKAFRGYFAIDITRELFVDTKL